MLSLFLNCFVFVYFPNSFPPKINTAMKRTRKITNKTFAIDAAPLAMPVNPNMPISNLLISEMPQNMVLKTSKRTFIARVFRRSPLDNHSISFAMTLIFMNLLPFARALPLFLAIYISSSLVSLFRSLLLAR